MQCMHMRVLINPHPFQLMHAEASWGVSLRFTAYQCMHATHQIYAANISALWWPHRPLYCS